MATGEKVGMRIKSYREQLKMSPADLAAHSGVDEVLILAVEAGEVLPALGILTKLSRALGQRLGTFMDDQFQPDPVITRASDVAAETVTHTGKARDGYTYHSLARGKPDRHMEPFKIELAPSASEPLSSHEGEELIICIAGVVRIDYGTESVLLNPGDTAYYNCVVKHRVCSAGDAPATIYGIVFQPF